MTAHQEQAWTRELRRQAEQEQWPTPMLVQKIYAEGCRRGAVVSLLAAHRIARGWSQPELAEKLGPLRASCGRTSPVRVKTISGWERGHHRPDHDDLDALCRLYEASADQLGFPAPNYAPAVPERPPTAVVPVTPAVMAVPTDDAAMLRRTVEEVPAPTPPGEPSFGIDAQGLPMQLTALLTGVRRSVDQLLESSMVADSTVDRWERTALHYGQTYQITPPVQMMLEVAADLAAVRELRERRQPLNQKQRLTRVIAQLSGLIGVLAIDLGAYKVSRDWFHTARMAAEDVEDRALRAWVQTREAVGAFYEGHFDIASEMAAAAETLATRTSSPATAMAPMTAARALARLGDADAARAAADRAFAAFDRLPGASATDTLYAYTERQLNFHGAQVWTYTDDLDRATEAHERAHALYAPSEYLDPALMSFDAALRIVRAGDPVSGAEHAITVLNGLAEGQHTEIIDVQARTVLRAVPPSARNNGTVQVYREILTFRTPELG